MKDKKLFLILFIILVIATIAVIIVKNTTKIDEEVANTTEITPGEEMTEEQERQTMIALYYTNVETNTLIPEAKVIDAKDLLENPYKILVEYIISKPKNEKLKSSLPEGTKVNNASLNGNIVTVDLSKEFIENQSEEAIKLGIYAIVNTLTELNEVDSVKISIDGEENKVVENTSINLSESFSRIAT